MNLKNWKLSSWAFFSCRKRSLKSWRINVLWYWISLMGGNPSVSSSWTTCLNSSNDGSIFSGISAVRENPSKAMPYFISFGSTNNSHWLHMGMKFGFSSLGLGICHIGWLLVAARSINEMMNLSELTALQLVVAVVALLSRSTNTISWTVGVESPSLLPPKQDYELIKVFSSASKFL